MVVKKRKRGQDADLVRLPYFDWDKTKYFYYIAKLGSFLEAGRFLNVSQSALSRKIAALEGHINSLLFVRQSRGVHLTPVGQQLYSIVERTFYDMKEFAHSISINNGQPRCIRVASTMAIVEQLLSDCLVDYTLKNSPLRLELIGEKYRVDSDVSNFDIAIRPLAPSESNFIQKKLCRLEKKLYASPEYLANHGTPKSVEDLANHHLLSVDVHSHEMYVYSDVLWILKLGQKQNAPMHKPFLTSNSLQVLINAAEAGVGIVSSYSQYRLIRKSKNLVNILPEISKTEEYLYVTYPSYLKDDPIINEMVELIFSSVNS